MKNKILIGTSLTKCEPSGILVFLSNGTTITTLLSIFSSKKIKTVGDDLFPIKSSFDNKTFF